MDWPRPVPAASHARVPPYSGLPAFRTQYSSGARCSMLCPVAPRSFISTTSVRSSSRAKFAASTVHGRFVARTRLLMTGPATPKPAARTRSPVMCCAACSENSRTIRSNCAKSLLANRCLKMGVSFPFFSEKSARLHFVPPTSPARITESPRRAAVRYRYPGSKSWIDPLFPVTFEQEIRFARAPASRRILRNLGALRGAPNVKNGVDERPSGFDVVAAIKERGVAAQAIVDECGVSAARGFAKALLVAEVHVDISDAHLSSWALGAEGNGDSLFWLNVENEAVRLDGTIPEHDVG